MTKQFKDLIKQLNDLEIVNYISELTRQNNSDIIYNKINSPYYYSSLEILLCSFSFKESIKGKDYWNEIVVIIRQKNKPITALAPDIQIKL
jgi:hypothetical protein